MEFIKNLEETDIVMHSYWLDPKNMVVVEEARNRISYVPILVKRMKTYMHTKDAFCKSPCKQKDTL